MATVNMVNFVGFRRQQAQLERQNAAVALVQALGGGWTAGELK